MEDASAVDCNTWHMVSLFLFNAETDAASAINTWHMVYSYPRKVMVVMFQEHPWIVKNANYGCGKRNAYYYILNPKYATKYVPKTLISFQTAQIHYPWKKEYKGIPTYCTVLHCCVSHERRILDIKSLEGVLCFLDATTVCCCNITF